MGASIEWNRQKNEGKEYRSLMFHPPYKKGTGCVFACYRLKVPGRGMVFSAKAGKVGWSIPGDGILFKVEVKAAGKVRECPFELTVKDYKWHDVSVDLSRWRGQSVDLYLVGDPGPANNTYGDGGGWADLKLVCP